MQHTQLYDRTRRNIGRRKAETQTRVYGGRNWNHITTREGERLSQTKFLPEIIQMWWLLMIKLIPILCWNNRKIMYRVPHVFILMDPGKAFPTKSRLASMTYSYFGFSCTHCETLKIDPKQNHSPVHTTKKNSRELTFLFFLRSNWTTLWDWDAGSEGGMVWVVTSPRPRPTNNF